MRYICLHLFALIIGVTILIIPSSPHFAFANDAPINLMTGGATALTGPLDVRMDSEVVTIILGANSYVIDATFNFFNDGEARGLHVGFPKRGEGYLDDRFSHTSDFIKFETWVDDQKVVFTEEPDVASIEGQYTLPALIEVIKAKKPDEHSGLGAKDYRWMAKQVYFQSNKYTKTRVRYEAPYQSFGYCKGVQYIYGTGSYWKGNIGKSTFIVDATNLPEKDKPYDLSFPSEKNNNQITRKKNGKTIESELKNYKPVKDAKVIISVGCPD